MWLCISVLAMYVLGVIQDTPGDTYGRVSIHSVPINRPFPISAKNNRLISSFCHLDPPVEPGALADLCPERMDWKHEPNQSKPWEPPGTRHKRTNKAIHPVQSFISTWIRQYRLHCENMLVNIHYKSLDNDDLDPAMTQCDMKCFHQIILTSNSKSTVLSVWQSASNAKPMRKTIAACHAKGHAHAWAQVHKTLMQIAT